MESALRTSVRADIFVTFAAERTTRLVGVGVMAGAAFRFDVGMALNNPTWHEQPLQPCRIRRAADQEQKQASAQRSPECGIGLHME